MQNDPRGFKVLYRLLANRYQQFVHKDGLCDAGIALSKSVPFGDKGTYTHRTATSFEAGVTFEALVVSSVVPEKNAAVRGRGRQETNRLVRSAAESRCGH